MPRPKKTVNKAPEKEQSKIADQKPERSQKKNASIRRNTLGRLFLKFGPCRSLPPLCNFQVLFCLQAPGARRCRHRNKPRTKISIQYSGLKYAALYQKILGQEIYSG